MVGAVRGDDPQTGKPFDDTKRYVDNAPGLSAADKKRIFEDNAYRAYPRLKDTIASRPNVSSAHPPLGRERRDAPKVSA